MHVPRKHVYVPKTRRKWRSWGGWRKRSVFLRGALEWTVQRWKKWENLYIRETALINAYDRGLPLPRWWAEAAAVRLLKSYVCNGAEIRFSLASDCSAEPRIQTVRPASTQPYTVRNRKSGDCQRLLEVFPQDPAHNVSKFTYVMPIIENYVFSLSDLWEWRFSELVISLAIDIIDWIVNTVPTQTRQWLTRRTQATRTRFGIMAVT